MNAPIPASQAPTRLHQAFERQKLAFAADRHPDLAARRDRLERLLKLVTAHEGEFVASATGRRMKRVLRSFTSSRRKRARR